MTLRTQNELAFIPLLTFYKAGLLTDIRSLACPLNHEEINNSALQFDTIDYATGIEPYGATHYLFTFVYFKNSAANRVIAGDCADVDGEGYSDNHGDIAPSKYQVVGGKRNGAHALFMDGHVVLAPKIPSPELADTHSHGRKSNWPMSRMGRWRQGLYHLWLMDRRPQASEKQIHRQCPIMYVMLRCRFGI